MADLPVSAPVGALADTDKLQAFRETPPALCAQVSLAEATGTTTGVLTKAQLDFIFQSVLEIRAILDKVGLAVDTPAA